MKFIFDESKYVNYEHTYMYLGVIAKNMNIINLFSQSFRQSLFWWGKFQIPNYV